jgi:hypothetical protein
VVCENLKPTISEKKQPKFTIENKNRVRIRFSPIYENSMRIYLATHVVDTFSTIQAAADLRKAAKCEQKRPAGHFPEAYQNWLFSSDFASNPEALCDWRIKKDQISEPEA